MADSQISMRIGSEPEDLELPDDEFKGVCRYCFGVVLVPRAAPDGRLQPEAAWCCFCGQRYRVSGGLVAVEQKLRAEESCDRMERGMTHEEMLSAALNRPRNYQELSSEQQWAIDKELGILDWEGPRTDDERKLLDDHHGLETRPPRNFRKELESLLNRYSKENGSDTPDFILAEYLEGCLDAFDVAVCRRTEWYRAGGMPPTGDGET